MFNFSDYESGQQIELQNLKKENQNLKDRLKVDAVSCIGNNDQILNQVEGNMSVKNHILALNESIGEFFKLFLLQILFPFFYWMKLYTFELKTFTIQRKIINHKLKSFSFQ